MVLKMKLIFLEIFILLAVDIYFGFALTFQNERNEDSPDNYNLFKFMKKSSEQINKLQELKLLSEEDINFVVQLEKFLTISIHSALSHMLSEASSNECFEDLKYVFENLWSSNGWAVKMVDSYGKPESGILEGNLKWLGQYDECVGIQAPFQQNSSVGGFRGKYCTLQVPLELGSVPLPMSTGVCLPESCNANENIFNILKEYNFNGSFSDDAERLKSLFSNAKLTCKATSRKLTTEAIVVICLLSIFVLLAVVGSSITAFEYYVEGKVSKNNQFGFEGTCLEKCKTFFHLFCIFTNGEKILNTSSSEDQIPFLHGIRFWSMTWVILCHTYFVAFTSLNNIVETVDYLNSWSFEIITNGFFCVDTFFILSGFLVGHIFFHQAQKTDEGFPWLYFYIHRYIRLMPVYMLVLAFYTTINPFLGSGPLWPDGDFNQECKENWWKNMLFINNFQSLFTNQCMQWSWYLANDMQFYIISPLFLITLFRWPKAGYSLLGLFFCITFACNFVLTYEYDIIPGIANVLQNSNNIVKFMSRKNDFFDKIYFKPYTRIGPYLVGLLLAYYVHRRKHSNAHSLNWVALLVGWTVASGIALVCQFGLHNQVLTTVEACFYNTFSRVGFALAIGWVIFVCIIGQGGIVSSILSWKALIPLSRLSYCAYLVHPIVLKAYIYSMRTLIYFNHMNVIMIYLGIVLMSYAVALVVSLLFESPIIRLEKLIKYLHREKMIYPLIKTK